MSHSGQWRVDATIPPYGLMSLRREWRESWPPDADKSPALAVVCFRRGAAGQVRPCLTAPLSGLAGACLWALPQARKMPRGVGNGGGGGGGG